LLLSAFSSCSSFSIRPCPALSITLLDTWGTFYLYQLPRIFLFGRPFAAAQGCFVSPLMIGAFLTALT
jgi:hypothetical protein